MQHGSCGKCGRALSLAKRGIPGVSPNSTNAQFRLVFRVSREFRQPYGVRDQNASETNRLPSFQTAPSILTDVSVRVWCPRLPKTAPSIRAVQYVCGVLSVGQQQSWGRSNMRRTDCKLLRLLRFWSPMQKARFLHLTLTLLSSLVCFSQNYDFFFSKIVYFIQ